MAIEYRYGNDLDLDQVIELYRASTLGDRRPIDDRQSMAAMMQHANLVVTAWDAQEIVGIARTLTDFAYVGYMSDLAVHRTYQRKGIGKELIARTRDAMGPHAKIVLLAAPRAVGYYPHVGFSQHPSAWILHATDPFPSPQRSATSRRSAI